MYHRRPRRFKRRSNGRHQHSDRSNNNGVRLRSNLFSHEQTRNNFRTIHNPEKLFEKYKVLAKEALSSGDKTLCENYLQHADHYMRLAEDKNKNQIANKTTSTQQDTNTDTAQKNNIKEVKE